MRLLLALVLVSASLAGCAAPEEAPPTPTPPPADDSSPAEDSSPLTLTQATPPPIGLSVEEFAEGALVVRLKNGGTDTIDVAPTSFMLQDGRGTEWPGSESSASDALGNSTVEPDGSTQGRVEFGFDELPSPTRLTYREGNATATWLLHVSSFAVEIEPEDDTSFGQPIELPSNGTIAYRATGIEGDVVLCVIEDAAHQTWLANGTGTGYGCRKSPAGDADASVLLPRGTYNVGMACRDAAEPCRFTLTVIASW